VVAPSVVGPQWAVSAAQPAVGVVHIEHWAWSAIQACLAEQEWHLCQTRWRSGWTAACRLVIDPFCFKLKVKRFGRSLKG